MTTLDQLANLHRTDKGTLYVHHNVHGYAPIYEQYLSSWKEKNIRLLEIGVYLEPPGGQSIKMWLDYFPHATVYAFDILDLSKHEIVLNSNRVKFFRGDQGKREDFTAMHTEFGEQPFDFILEDGSHQSEHQIISLAATFKYVKSGGFYILEDMSIPEHPVCCIRNDETYKTILEFKNTGKLSCDYLSPEEIKYLETNVASIDIHHDIKDAYAVAIITKR